MPRTIRRCCFTLLWLLASSTATAAQDIVTASQGTLLDDIEDVLQSERIVLLELAQTDRFALIYATCENGAHLTITLAQEPLEETHITLTVTSDSPSDEEFDRVLLQALVQTQI